MDYTLNIVSKCRFFFIFKHSRAPNRFLKIIHGGPGKSWKSPGFLSVKEWEPWIDIYDDSECFAINTYFTFIFFQVISIYAVDVNVSC